MGVAAKVGGANRDHTHWLVSCLKSLNSKQYRLLADKMVKKGCSTSSLLELFGSLLAIKIKITIFIFWGKIPKIDPPDLRNI